MRGILQDVGFAVRSVRSRPAFLATAVLTLALGVGANVAIFSAVRAVLLDDLPYPEPDQLVHVSLRTTELPEGGLVPSVRMFEYIEASATEFSALGVAVPEEPTLTGSGDAEQIDARAISRGFGAVSGLAPLAGRLLQPQDFADGADAVLISRRFSLARFGGDDAAVGRQIRLQGVAKTIVGVVPDEFDAGGPRTDSPALWLPLVWKDGQGSIGSQMVARLAPGLDAPTAESRVSRLAASLSEVEGGSTHITGLRLMPLAERDRAGIRAGLLLLQGISGFLLLIACANLVNLFLANATIRGREFGVRAALGAGRWRLVRQWLTEAVVIALAGGALGVALAYLSVPVLVASASWTLPRAGAIGIRGPELAAGLGLALLAALAAAAIPALIASRADVVATLRGGMQVTRGRMTRALRNGLVAAEVLLAVILVTGAGLLINSFARVASLPMGFDSRGLVVAEIPLTYREPERRLAFARALHEDLRARFGDGHVAIGSMPYSSAELAPAPLVQASTAGEAASAPAGTAQRARSIPFRTVSHDYFETLGIRLVRGRPFLPTDTATSPRVIIVNEQFVRDFGHGQGLVGEGVRSGRVELEVVGIAGDTRSGRVSQPPAAAVYFPLEQRRFPITVAVRAPDAAVLPALREAVRRLDPNVPVARAEAIEARMRRAEAQRRFYVLMLSLFGALGAALAAGGVYGVMTHVTGQRTRELGIRAALGARPAQIQGLVVRQGLRPVVIGVVGGVLGAFWLTGLLKTVPLFTAQLYEITPHDPLTFALASAALFTVGAIACWLPARRGARVDPVTVLRAE
jgi:putative ABC transport system permease protein